MRYVMITIGALVACLLPALSHAESAAAGQAQQAAEGAQKAPDFEELLKKAAADSKLHAGVRIEVDGLLAEKVSSLVIYGRGVAIWNRERQLSLKTEQVKAALQLLVDARVWEMDEVIRKNSGDASWIRRGLKVTIGAVTRTVKQDKYSPVDPDFEKLLADLVALCRTNVDSGITASDLEDGLRKVAEGELAPEALRISVNASQMRSLKSQEGQGWLFDLSHGMLDTRSHSLQSGVSESLIKPLPAREAQNLARILIDTDASHLPKNLHHSGYCQIMIAVLNHHHQIMARRFGGTQPEPDKPLLARYGKLRSALHTLFARQMSGKELFEEQELKGPPAKKPVG